MGTAYLRHNAGGHPSNGTKSACQRRPWKAFLTDLFQLYMAQYLELSDCEPAHTASHKAWMVTRQAVSMGLSVCAFHHPCFIQLTMPSPVLLDWTACVEDMH